MPIYEYRCTDCGFQDEFLQKLSEPQLTVCPSCGKASFRKQLTAAGFQLKGSGWYATDFKNSGSKASTGTGVAAADKKTSDAGSKSDSKSEPAVATKSESKAEPKPGAAAGSAAGKGSSPASAT